VLRGFPEPESGNAETLKAENSNADTEKRRGAASAWRAGAEVRGRTARSGLLLATSGAQFIRRGREFTMNEQVINLIVKKTGISQENAQKAVLVVFDFLKTKLPAPIASQVDSFLNTGSVNTSGITEQAGSFLKSKVGGVFAGKS
jgi:hypothetical protein